MGGQKNLGSFQFEAFNKSHKNLPFNFGCSLCLVYSPVPEYFSPVGCHKMAFCSQLKEQKSLSCLPLASAMYRHSMALNSNCR